MRRQTSTVPESRRDAQAEAAQRCGSGVGHWGGQRFGPACPPSATPQPVRVFGTFTPDLHALADWLAQCQVTTRGDGIDGGVLDSDL